MNGVAEREIVWSDDVERKLDVGDRVRGIIELEVELPPEKPLRDWIAGVGTHEIEELWNAALAKKGETTRVSVTAMRPVVNGGFLTGNPSTVGVSFEIVGLVTHNNPIVAWALVALLASALAADIVLNDAKILTRSVKAVATAVGEGLAAVAKPLGLPLALAAAVLLGVFLWVR